MPPPPKPIVVWVAQIWFALLLAASAYVSYQNLRFWIESPHLMVRSAGILLATLATLVGLQLRLAFARYSAVALTLAFLGLQLWNTRDLSTLVSFAVFELLLAWRLAFGEPSRAYFAGKPVSAPPSFEES